MFYFILVIVLVCAAVLYLPQMAGLTHLEKQKKQKKPVHQQKHEDPVSGYIPPDEEIRRQKEEEERKSLAARASGLKQKMNLTNDDVPLKIRLNNEETLTRRKEKISTDHNPDTYDYDLDELINQETGRTAEKGKFSGESNEDLV